MRETATLIVEQQTPQRLLEIRARLYELLTHCIPPEIIIKVSEIRSVPATQSNICTSLYIVFSHVSAGKLILYVYLGDNTTVDMV